MKSNYIQSVLDSYLTCAIWSSVDDDGNELDQFGIMDFTEDAKKRALADCEDFISKAGSEWLENLDPELVGHDLWLTRNGHGAGFWDREIPHGEELSTLARKMGEVNVLVEPEGLMIY